METRADAENETIVIEDGIRVFPCHCGKTHRGSYAHEAWNHHNCSHEGVLMLIADGQAVCGDCGASFMVEDARDWTRLLPEVPTT